MTKKKGLQLEVEQPKTKAPLEKVEVTFKQVGKNLNITLGDEKITRTGEKEELAEIKDAIKLYDSKPTKSNLQVIQKLLKPVSVAKEKEVEIVKAEAKLTKKKTKDENKGIKTTSTKPSIENISLLKEENEKLKERIKELEKTPEPVSRISSYRRSGEH